MRFRTLLTTVGVTAGVLLIAPAAQAQDEYFFGWTGGVNPTQLVTDQGTFNHVDRGWVTNAGLHDDINDNYFTGSFLGTDFYRSFFLFDLANLGATVTSATLRAWNPGGSFPGYLSPDPTETYILSFVNPTWYDEMRVDQFGNTGFFGGLFGGGQVGSRVVSAADNGTWVEFTLDANGIAAINRLAGSEFGLGGCLEGIGGSCDAGEPTSTVPEPATMTLLATGLAGMAAARRRKRA